MNYPGSIQKLIEQLIKLPSIGQKTAERMAFHLLEYGDAELDAFAAALRELKRGTKTCSVCGTTAEKDPCGICSEQKRDRGLLCVVADSRDLRSIESSGSYNGLYHVLGGEIDLISGKRPEQLNINKLLDRLRTGGIREILLALNPTIEGETTVLYLTKAVRERGFPGVRLTRLARGLPAGADIEYADEITLENSVRNRSEIQENIPS